METSLKATANKPSVHISSDVISYLKNSDKTKSQTNNFLIRMKTTGCSGFSFSTERVEAFNDTDITWIQDEFTFGIEQKHAQFFNGMKVDIEKTIFSTKLTYTSPLETSRCGCGESVQLKI